MSHFAIAMLNVEHVKKNREVWSGLKVGDLVKYTERIRRTSNSIKESEFKLIFKSECLLVGRHKGINESYCFCDLVSGDIKIRGGNDND